MAQAMVNFRMEENLKIDMEITCKKMGLTPSAAYTLFAKKVTMEQRIPFEITADPLALKIWSVSRERFPISTQDGTYPSMN